MRLILYSYANKNIQYIITLFRGSMNDREEIELDKDTADVINNINPPQHFKADRKGKM